MPDWVFNTDTMTFSTKDLEEQKKNRPAINLEIYETKRKREYWAVFRKYNYLNHEINNAARVFVCYANGKLAAFSSVLATPLFCGKYMRAHRIVVLPDYQGIGIARAMENLIGRTYKAQNVNYSIITSSRSMIEGLKKSREWKCERISRIDKHHGGTDVKKYKNETSRSSNRITATFKYIG